jgi:hypothetical protein
VNSAPRICDRCGSQRRRAERSGEATERSVLQRPRKPARMHDSRSWVGLLSHHAAVHQRTVGFVASSRKLSSVCSHSEREGKGSVIAHRSKFTFRLRRRLSAVTDAASTALRTRRNPHRALRSRWRACAPRLDRVFACLASSQRRAGSEAPARCGSPQQVPTARIGHSNVINHDVRSMPSDDPADFLVGVAHVGQQRGVAMVAVLLEPVAQHLKQGCAVIEND